MSNWCDDLSSHPIEVSVSTRKRRETKKPRVFTSETRVRKDGDDCGNR